MDRFNIDLYPQDPEALDADCRDLHRRAKHLNQWMEVAEIVWRQGGDLMSVLGEHLLRALWPDIRRLDFSRPLGREFGGKGNWGHLETFLAPSIHPFYAISPVRAQHGNLVRLSGWFYSAACQKLDYRQAIEWVYFGLGSSGERAFVLMWSDWNYGIPSFVSPTAVAALKLYRGELLVASSLGVETWKEKELKGFSSNQGRESWDGEVEQACGEGGGVIKKNERGLLEPVPDNFELPWWQSLIDLSSAGTGLGMKNLLSLAD